MDEPKEKIGMNHGKQVLNPFAIKKPKKRSLVERELETNMTARVTSPVTVADGVSTSRYGRARKIKTGLDKKFMDELKSPKSENTPLKTQSPITKSVVNSSYKTETPKKALETSLDNIDNICQDNKSLTSFCSEKALPKSLSSAKKEHKVYIRQDLIQNRDNDDDDDGIMMIKDLFSRKSKSSRKQGKVLNSSLEKHKSCFSKQNGHVENLSVVKTLNFDDNNRDSNGNKRDSKGNKKASDDNKRESLDNKRDSDGNKRDSDDNKNNDTQSAHKNESLEVEVTCSYQVGDLAWARMGTFPFWPCIITRDPETELFVRKKLFGRVQHNIIHVTFFADNGRRSWVADNMLRKYMGLEEFLSARDMFTSEDKKKDPRLYSAFFISEKKQSLWNASVEEAEILNREPKGQRIDIFNDLLYQARVSKKQHKSGKVTRTDSDVSLSESLYDSLFSEDDIKTDDSNRSRNKSRNKSLDVSDVVTACLDNMAAKTGNIKIQRQSHMDRWLQKAKSKTPEKVKTKTEQILPITPVITPKIETVTPIKVTSHDKSDYANVEKVENPAPKVEKPVSNNKKKKLPPKEVKITKVYSLRRSYESQNALSEQMENKKNVSKNDDKNKIEKHNLGNYCLKDERETEFKKEITSKCGGKDCLDIKIDLLKDNTYTSSDNDAVLNAINELLEDTSATVSKDLLSKPSCTIGDSDKGLKVEPLTDNGNIDIKPEVMDVDETRDNTVQGIDKPAVISEVILDSPIKTEKESTIYGNFGRPVQIDCDSPVKMEIESSMETTSLSKRNIKVKQDEIEIEIRSNSVLDKFTHQTSPTLKSNEMVSIPENSHMTDDESESIASMDNTDVVDLQDHNINPANISAMTNNYIGDLTAKVIEDKSADINSTMKQENVIQNIDINITKPDVASEDHENIMSIDKIENEDITMNEKDLLNESGHSESLLQIDNDLDNFVSDKPEVVEKLVKISLNGIQKSELIQETFKNDALEGSSTRVKSDENTRNNNSESKSFLGDSLNIDVYKDPSTATDIIFPEIYINKSSHLTTESIAAKADLLETVQYNDCEYDEDSDDEPSPEYEPLGDDITEDFRQHMKCIESNITDKKDEAQLVKVCYEIAEIEESKAKLVDVKLGMKIDSTLNSSLEQTQRIIKEKITEGLSKSVKLNQNNEIRKEHIEKAKPIKSNENGNVKVKSENFANDGSVELDLINTSDNNLVKENKMEILDGLNIIKKAVENNVKSPIDRKKHKLSLKRDKSRCEDIYTKQSILNNTTVNPRYKTIDQIEEIIKSKPKRLPIENGEVCIPEIKVNGYHTKREMDTPDRYDDDDFDIDDVSVNSEDSEVSIPQEKVPSRRSLRSRPVKTCGLQDPEFLTFMELRKDDLVEEHPELSMDDIVLYLYKTYIYTQKERSDVELDEPVLLEKSIKQETPTPSRKKSKKSTQPKITIENFFRAKYNNTKKIDFDSESGTFDSNDDVKAKREMRSISPVDSGIGNSKDSNESDTSYTKQKSLSNSPQIDLASKITKDVKVELINDVTHHKDASSPKTPKRLRKKTISPKVLGSVDLKVSSKLLEKSLDKRVPVVVISPIKNKLIEAKHMNKTNIKYELGIEPDHKTNTEAMYEPVTKMKPEPHTETKHPEVAEKHNTETAAKPEAVVKHEPVIETKHKEVSDTKHDPDPDTIHEQDIDTKQERETETESMDSDSELPLRLLRSKVLKENKFNELKKEILDLKDEIEDTASVSSDNVPLLRLKPRRVDKSIEGSYEDPNFLKYLELKQDDIIDENPQLSQNEITAYLYKTWIYEKDSKSDMQKNDDIKSSNLVKGLNEEPAPPRKPKRKPKTEKNTDSEEIIAKDKPKRKTVSHYYNEAYLSDIEDELEIFEIFKTKKTPVTVVSKPDSPKKEEVNTETKTDDTLKSEMEDICEEINTLDEIELYFKQLTIPKPSVFKGLIREKVCEICEDVANLIKCKGCNGTFHYDCVKTVIKPVEIPAVYKGRKKKKKLGRKPKNLDDSEHSDERDVSIDTEENVSIEEIAETITIDADVLEVQIAAKMKELLDKEPELNYDSYSSDDGIDWSETIPGKCELVDVKLKKRAPPIDYTNFKCNNCQKYDTPLCFVCKSAVSKTGVKIRQNCNVAHCYNYYHLECLDHWPQTQFNAGEWTRGHKKTSEQFEALTCPRHVCHTCVSDDPRGCKTRFSGDKLAKCVRCPATYHSFNKCLPAGTQILTASLIICPRHYEHRPGKVPCHVNTGWCFICALGGSLICCEYCPTSFHAECLNIKPPEGNYMCEDCETGRLPLYEEMVWVKLGHYRWWPGVILHPSEIPENIMAVKHGLGEFVVRFFGQYDHYWVNRGRVFPYQEGDSGRISSQKSKIDLAFTTAMEHAQRAFEILKNAEPDEEESLDIASSLLPPHYVKLKCNKPIGSLLGRKIEDPSLSLTQCECSPAETEPCGPNSQCINRMLLTECGPTCRAGDRCSNRAFEKRLYPKLTPYRASHRGWGLKTLEDIKAGQFVIEYVGELIDVEEFQRRMRRKHEIRDENFYFLTLDKERMIDAGPKGNLARFMNHCCEPNCETQKWTVLGDIRVGLFAIDDIKANSEVTFNYNLECTGIEKKRCMCGAKRCSGYIGAKPKQLDETQRKKNCTITGKRKYTKRKNMEDSPNTIKNKVKKPIGRPPKPKELTEIEKDLLIIKSAITGSSGESRCQSVEEKNLKPMKKKEDSDAMEQGLILSTENTVTKVESRRQSVEEKSLKPLKKKEDSNETEQSSILNTENTVTKVESRLISVEEKNLKPLKKKEDSNATEQGSVLSTEDAVTNVESRRQSVEEKNLKPLKRKDSNTTAEGSILSTENTVTKICSQDVIPVSNWKDSKSIKLKDSNTMPEVPILNGNMKNTVQAAPIFNGMVSKKLKRKLDSNPSEEVTISSAEPIAKRHKCEQIEVGD